MKNAIVLGIITLSLFFNVGCNKNPSSGIQQVALYKQTSSTCDAPATYMRAISDQLFTDGVPTKLEISQNFSPYRVCKFKATAILNPAGGAISTQYLSVSEAGGDCTGIDFAWEESYNFNRTGNTLTLTSASCVNTYDLQ